MQYYYRFPCFDMYIVIMCIPVIMYAVLLSVSLLCFGNEASRDRYIGPVDPLVGWSVSTQLSKKFKMCSFNNTFPAEA